MATMLGSKLPSPAPPPPPSGSGRGGRVVNLARTRWPLAVAAVIGLMIGSLGRPADLTSDLASLQKQLADQKANVSALTTKNVSLGSQNRELQGQVAELQERVREANASRPLLKLVGQPLEDVNAIAERFGWSVTVKEKESGKPVGTVLSQSPKPGRMMSLGALFTVVVAKPLPPKIPNLLGKTRKAANTLADKYGWKLNVKREESLQPAGTIISQTPAAGTFMRGAASFTIVLAKSKCDPNYRGACLKPNAGDYDCAGGSGHGPLYVTGPVYVVGYDIFGLDGDGNGVGCE